MVSAVKTNDEAVIRGMIADWAKALQARDIDGLVANYVPDAVLFDVKPPYKVEGPAAIRALWEACLPYFPKQFRSEHRDLKLVVGDDVAVCHGLHHIVPIDQPNHPAGESWLRVTVAYQKVAGQWRVTHEHVSLPFNPGTDKVVMITDPNVLGSINGCCQ